MKLSNAFFILFLGLASWAVIIALGWALWTIASRQFFQPQVHPSVAHHETH